MFNKILIANRNEIARRVIRTADRLGIDTVAVFSDADRDAPFVREATQAIHIGPPAASESYLNIERVIEAAKLSDAEAIHPGYGFLSENALFAEACAENGIVFIGPSADTIRAMGSKETAKAIMVDHGVPVVPGGDDDPDPKVLGQRAVDIGLPVLIKAVAGGGGRGMRLVRTQQEFDGALTSARREAKSAFGNDAVLIEKYIEQPRHIEVQIFGDAHGNVVHLFERDCSVQRRYQKVIEEAPAASLNEDQRKKLYDAAVRAGKAVDYVGAGTVEFVIDRAGEIYFIEMNTRLQVEHPVTEMICGEDLVEWQLEVAAGAALPEQASISPSGHAIELRLCAEDPTNEFAPSTGRLPDFYIESNDVGFRLDSGVEAGSAITPYYDSMFAKLIVSGKDRHAAINNAMTALNAVRVSGVQTNINFLRNIISSKPFIDGGIDTHFVDNEQATLTARQVPNETDLAAAALYLFDAYESLEVLSSGHASPWNRCFGFRTNLPYARVIAIGHDETIYEVTVQSSGNTRDIHRWVELADRTMKALLAPIGGQRYQLVSGGEVHTFEILESDRQLYVYGHHSNLVFNKYEQMHDGSDEEAGSGKLMAPMPGTVLEVFVAVDDHVTAGTPLMLLEAMKIEHTISAPFDGTISEIRFNPGEQIGAEGVQLIVMQASDSDD